MAGQGRKKEREKKANGVAYGARIDSAPACAPEPVLLVVQQMAKSAKNQAPFPFPKVGVWWWGNNQDTGAATLRLEAWASSSTVEGLIWGRSVSPLSPRVHPNPTYGVTSRLAGVTSGRCAAPCGGGLQWQRRPVWTGEQHTDRKSCQPCQARSKKTG